MRERASARSPDRYEVRNQHDRALISRGGGVTQSARNPRVQARKELMRLPGFTAQSSLPLNGNAWRGELHSAPAAGRIRPAQNPALDACLEGCTALPPAWQDACALACWAKYAYDLWGGPPTGPKTGPPDFPEYAEGAAEAGEAAEGIGLGATIGFAALGLALLGVAYAVGGTFLAPPPQPVTPPPPAPPPAVPQGCKKTIIDPNLVSGSVSGHAYGSKAGAEEDCVQQALRRCEASLSCSGNCGPVGCVPTVVPDYQNWVTGGYFLNYYSLMHYDCDCQCYSTAQVSRGFQR